MEQDNLSNKEVIAPQPLTETTPQLSSPESNKSAVGRPSIEEDKALQEEYLKIYHFKVLAGNIHNKRVAKAFNISEGKVKIACSWVRKTFEILTPEDYFKDGEALVGGRILDLNSQIEDCKKGELVFKADGTAVTDKAGKQVVRVDKKHLRGLMSQRRDYDKMLLELRIPRLTAQGLNNQTFIQNNVNIDIEQNVSIINGMAPEDKAKFMEILERYAEPPAES